MAILILSQKGNHKLVYDNITGTVLIQIASKDAQLLGQILVNEVNKVILYRLAQNPEIIAVGLGSVAALLILIAGLVIIAILAFFVEASRGCSAQKVTRTVALLTGAIAVQNQPLILQTVAILVDCLLRGLQVSAGSLVFVEGGEIVFANPINGASLPSPKSAPSGGDFVEAIDTGAYLVAGKNELDLTKFYDAAFTLIGSRTLFAKATATNFTDAFYVWSFNGTLTRFDAFNNVVDTWTVGGSASGKALAVSPDNSKAYVGFTGDNFVSECDLSGSGTLTPFVEKTGYKLQSSRPFIQGLRTGAVLIGWQSDDGQSSLVELYSPNGSSLATYALSSSDYLVALCASLDNISFWWIRGVTATSVRIERRSLNVGTLLEGFSKGTVSFDFANASMAVVPKTIT